MIVTVTLDEDLWIVTYPDGTRRLSRALVTVGAGTSAPKLVDAPVTVLKQGTTVAISQEGNI